MEDTLLYWHGFNLYYFLFMVPGLLLSIWASARVKRTFGTYNKVHTLNGLTGAQAARRILDLNGLQHVQVQQISGSLSDHYDPRTDVVSLSQATYDSASVGAVGVAAHEVGHAIQHAQGYAPAKVRSAIVPVTNISTSLSIPLIFVGFLLSVTGLIYLGIILFSASVLFQLVTLPVEFNASRRALQTLGDTNLLTPEENDGARKVLGAAALTYVAALLTSLLQLAYYIFLARGRRRR